VSWEQARKVELVAGDGKRLSPDAPNEPSEFVGELEFPPPFPPETIYRVELPAGLQTTPAVRSPAASR
jgi:hypothetical protein